MCVFLCMGVCVYVLPFLSVSGMDTGGRNSVCVLSSQVPGAALHAWESVLECVSVFVRAESPHLLAWHTLLSLRQRYRETLALSRDGTSSLYQTLPPSTGNTREVGRVCVCMSQRLACHTCVCVRACRRQIASPPDPNTEWPAVKLGVQSCIWKVCFSLCHVVRTHASPSPS